MPEAYSRPCVTCGARTTQKCYTRQCDQYFCDECVTECAGCYIFSCPSHLVKCDHECNDDYCSNCIHHCKKCNRKVCPECAGWCNVCSEVADCGSDDCERTVCEQCGKRLCDRCAIKCGVCQTRFSCKENPECNRECTQCHKRACADCIPSHCAVCDEYLCTACDDAQCDEHPVCDYCKLTCESCWRTLCPVCEPPCGDVFCDKVDKAFCDLHSNEKCDHVTEE